MKIYPQWLASDEREVCLWRGHGTTITWATDKWKHISGSVTLKLWQKVPIWLPWTLLLDKQEPAVKIIFREDYVQNTILPEYNPGTCLWFEEHCFDKPSQMDGNICLHQWIHLGMAKLGRRIWGREGEEGREEKGGGGREGRGGEGGRTIIF